ncbi:sulfurtransferase TusA family protein [Actinoplanes sp. N902-109]|uniref:sulfurtransferase TusA family protein n=1 Tax=Actinoplanes sp. (strain N902-109) TaxID=649831 RepID=UPI000329349E|nr:sulfurtransferase TusA family protein [Actinoplanes sp. N902-109]AGL15399.1 SirA family protein [Actinoplanes sp. N902-109]
MIEVDSRGRRCPLPIIDLAKALPGVAVGEIVRVLADDPAAANDIPAWCRMKSQGYEGSPRPGSYDVRRLR